MSLPRPELGLVVPVYDRPQFLAECLDSVFGQVEPYDEVVCVLATSPSYQTRRVLNSFRSHQALRIIEPGHSLGISRALNVGIRAVNSDYVSLADDDDRLVDTAAQLIRQHILQHDGRCKWISTRYRTIGGGNDRSDHDWRWELPFYSKSERDLLSQHMVASHLKTFETRWFLDQGAFDETFDGCQDWEACLRMTLDSPWCDVATVAYEHRVHGDQFSQNARVSIQRKVNHVRRGLWSGPKVPTESARQEMLAAAKWARQCLGADGAFAVFSGPLGLRLLPATTAGLEVLLSSEELDWILLVGGVAYDVGPAARWLRHGDPRPVLAMMAVSEWPNSIAQAQWQAAYVDRVICDPAAAALLSYVVDGATVLAVELQDAS